MRFAAVWLAAAVVLFGAGPAEAGFVAGAIKIIGGFFAGLGPVGAFLVRTVAGLALNAIARLFIRQPKRPEAQGGIRTQQTLSGGDNPDGMILGVYATDGAWVSPWVMHGENNRYNSQVIDLAGVPSEGLLRVFVNGSPITLGVTAHPDFGLPAEGDYADHLWIRFYDGTQSAADPMLVARGGSDPDFPWSADMVGVGRTYAIATYLENREIWQGVPSFRFEVSGASFYDMRKDGSNGGVGAHRLNDPATWEATENPMVMIAHLTLGYALPDGSIYGGEYDLTDLPLADWAAAMNACEADADDGDGGTEPAWRAGLEVLFDDEPQEAIGLLLAACDGDLVDVGGTLYPKVGAPGLPAAFITDDDFLIDRAQELDPFPGLRETVNGVALRHPDPDAAWEVTQAPQITSAAFEAADSGRRLISSLALPAVPYALQVQRLGQAVVRDARRFLRHKGHLPGDYAWLRPLQTVSWTSARNGYDAKLFEIAEKATDLLSYQSQVTLREVDPADYDPQAYLSRNTVSPAVTPPLAVELQNAGAEPWSISDGAQGRIPAIRAFWDGLAASGVEVEVKRQASGQIAARLTVPAGDGEAVVVGGILPGEFYTVRLAPVAEGRGVAVSGPFTVTAPDLRIAPIDLAQGQGRNLLQNTDFLDGTEGWSLVATGGQAAETELIRRLPGETYAGAYYPTLAVYQNGAGGGTAEVSCAPLLDDGNPAPGAPVVAGEWYEFSVQAAHLRSGADLAIRWFDDSGAEISTTATLASAGAAGGSSSNPEAWPRLWGKAQAPAGAAYGTPVVAKPATASGGDSWLFLHKPQFALTHADATRPAPFFHAGGGVFQGARLAAESIVAEKIVAGGISQQDFIGGSDTVTNDSASWTYYRDLEVDYARSAAGVVQYNFTLTALPSTLPTAARIEMVRDDGAVIMSAIPQATMADLNGDLRIFRGNAAFSNLSAGAHHFQIRMRNMGGAGLQAGQILVQATFR